MKDLEAIHLETIASVCSTSRTERRAKLEELARRMLALPGETLDLPVKHYFHGFTYMRELFIPAGVMLVGRIHLFDHLEILVSGDITLSTDADAPQRLTGYTVRNGYAGKQRAIYAHEDSIFMTVHSAEEQEPEAMYDYLTCGSYAEFDQFNEALSALNNASTLALEGDG